jgi:nicotinate-nucleotide pyrophosphorylase (carboxylating)
MLHIVRFDRLFDEALAEDLGIGDVTTDGLVSPFLRGRARVTSREPLTVAGVPVFQRVLQRLDPAIAVLDNAPEGSRLLAGETLVRLEGSMAALLTGERVALNFFQHLCGVATLTRKYVEALPDARTKILDTRKTTPGLRALERYAVRCGGGFNHRARLDGGMLIKDNHIAACGGVREAVALARESQGPSLRIEIEVSTLEQLEDALACDAEVVMLDNMGIELARDAMKMVADVRSRQPEGATRRPFIEVSGNVDPADVPRFARLGVDFISVGALTHSAPAIDLSMTVEPC